VVGVRLTIPPARRIVEHPAAPERRMVDPELPLYANRPLTPRQDRIEASIVRVLRAGGTRSELREAVYEFADFARMQQIPPERAVSMVKAVAMRASASAATGTLAVGDSQADRIAMIVRWCTARYYRVD
jgi:hypothetical protein